MTADAVEQKGAYDRVMEDNAEQKAQFDKMVVDSAEQKAQFDKVLGCRVVSIMLGVVAGYTQQAGLVCQLLWQLGAVTSFVQAAAVASKYRAALDKEPGVEQSLQLCVTNMLTHFVADESQTNNLPCLLLATCTD